MQFGFFEAKRSENKFFRNLARRYRTDVLYCLALRGVNRW